MLAKNQNPWSVNILAAFAGERMFSDKEFNEKKLAGIGNLSFNSAERLVVSAYLAGYSLKYGHSEFN